MGKRNQSADAVENYRYYPVGGVRTVFWNVLADFVGVDVRFPGEARSRSFRTLASFFGLCHQTPAGFLAVNGLYSSAFQIVVAPIQHFPRVGQLVM